MNRGVLARHEGHKQRILVVEDNDLNREMLSAILENDFNVLEAVDGVEEVSGGRFC